MEALQRRGLTGHEINSHIRPQPGRVEGVLHRARRALPERVPRRRRERIHSSGSDGGQIGAQSEQLDDFVHLSVE